MARFVTRGVNPFTKEPFDLLDVNAFALPRPARRWALTLAAAGEHSDRGTRLGGLPYLAANAQWPSHDGRPLVHLAQFDLTALARVDAEIEALKGPGGVLAIFLAVDQHVPSLSMPVIGMFVPDAEPARLAEAPYESLVRPAIPLVATPVTETETEVVRPWLPGEPPLHKLGGFGDWVQVNSRMHAYFDSHVPASDPAAADALTRAGIEPGSIRGSRAVLDAVSRIEALGIDASVLGRASAGFELLAQIDSDDGAGLCWGDVGRLYVFARESDVQRRSFRSLVACADSG
jgi:hypothetical protein